MDFNSGGLADYTIGTMKCYLNGRHGAALTAGHAAIHEIHGYLNQKDGIFVSASTGIRKIHSLRANDNGETGIQLSGNKTHVSVAAVDSNGRFAGVDDEERSGLRMAGALSDDNTIVDLYTTDNDGTPMQTYGMYIDSSGSGNLVGNFRHDGNNTVAPMYVDSTAASRNSVSINVPIKQTSATATGNQELDPASGDLVMTATLSGALDFDYTTATDVENGHRQKVYINNGGGQDITAGTNVTAIATLPTPATSARHGVLVFEYYDGEAFLVEAYEEP